MAEKAQDELPKKPDGAGQPALRLPRDAEVKTGFRRPILAGIAVFLLLFAGAGSWVAMARLAGAVVAAGRVVVKGQPKSIQHLDGGILKAIYVRNGQAVRQGDLLIELDDTLLQANLAIYRNRLLEALARKARLEAERDGREIDHAPPPLVSLLKLKGYENHLTGQEKIARARAVARDGMKAQMREKIKQLQQQLAGTEGLREARREQLGYIDKEMRGLTSLRKKGLVTSTRVLALARQRSELIGQLAEMESELARTRDAIRETKIAMLQIDRDFLEKTVTDLHAVDTGIQELTQQISATEEKLRRTKVRAPVSGLVHELQVHTIGGVISHGQIIMQIIPAGNGVEFETDVDPRFIDRVHKGQMVRLKFPAFNRHTTPEITGSVSWISPTSVIVRETGRSFYRVGVSVTREELKKLGGNTLLPGMPVEAFIQTSERTVLTYLVKPLMDNFAHAMKED